MKECLHCHNLYKYKREASKFCSDKCRVSYNRKHPKNNLTKVQVQALYNIVMEKLAHSKIELNSSIQYSAISPHSYDSPKKPDHYFQDEPPMFSTPKPRLNPEQIMRKYVEERREYTCEEEFKDWFDRLDSDERLTERQKQLVKVTN